ncbi:UDP-N-acetylmuramoyl-tripeptide--D-alanyl-D-alanine ligase [Dellaglioa sp. P0083]|uniref:UDP-N-acetylmuramoyl-tripeptide--D-alanyl-D- alanine ligase n=1 Tax=Dellaglioa kimchii TaxID=3344667 RepID=UPI0038D47611
MKMQLTEIASAVSAKNEISDEPINILSVSFDSRQLTEGSLFVPIVAENDGHDYIQSAIDNGATATLWAVDHQDTMPTEIPAILVDDTLKAYQDLAKHYLDKINPKVVAVTGSNGKTTTKDMITEILSQQYNVCKTEANFNNHLGVPMTLLSIEPNTEVVVVEMGMDHPGELDFLSRIAQPDVAVITMIGEAHIEFFGTRDKIADAKMEIVNGLKEDGLLVYNADEPLLRERVSNIEQQSFGFGHGESADLSVSNVVGNQTMTSFKVREMADFNFTIPMIGTYNVDNAMAAISVGRHYRVSPENIVKALSDFDLTKNRTEWLRGHLGESILSDVYNSNPTAAKAVIKAFSNSDVEGNRMVVLGDMLELGEQSSDMHLSLADSFDNEKIQSIYLYGEQIKSLATALKSKYDDQHLHYYDLDEKENMVRDLLKIRTEKDSILIKGSHGVHLETVLSALQSN